MAASSQQLPTTLADPGTAGCAKLLDEYDWTESDFGPQDSWDPAVESIVRILVEASAPMAYCHGPGHAMVYNDSFAEMLGTRHPRAWGRPAAVVMPEIWSRPGYAEAVDRVFAGGPPFHDDGEMLDRHGLYQTHPDWAYLARSYSAVRDRGGSVLGILVVVVESAPVLVLVGAGDHSAARWRGRELWDETMARRQLIWSGFRAGARPPEPAVSEPDQRFVTEGSGQLILPINGADVGGFIGYLAMPRSLPDVQTVTLAPRDQEDTTATSVGEFYDVFGMPDGRVAVTIGDVVGAGSASAAVMAQLKVDLRAAALTSADPSSILAALDEPVSRLDTERGGGGFGGELFVTALLGVFDPANGELLLASAGHPPPAVVRRLVAGARGDAGRLAEFVNVEPGPPLGIAGRRPVLPFVLQEGDALVGFTNGLLQRYDQSLAQGQGALLRTLGSMSSTAPRSISQHVIDELVGGQGLEHDCALLVVVRDSRAHQLASVLVPPHAIAVRGARRWTHDQLESWHLDEDTIADVVLSVSELVTNVGLHAGTSARVTLELADRLLVTVEDTGTWGAPRPGREDHTAVQGRGLALVAALSDAMGHARGVDGSTVWFEIVLDRMGS